MRIDRGNDLGDMEYMRLDRKEDIEQICRQVAEIVMKAAGLSFRDEIRVNRKGHGNFVSEADLEIEAYLLRKLHDLLPEAGFISEETDPNAREDYNWIIDPIDGTTNYLFGYPYALSVALKDEKTQETVIGVIYAPASEELYYACRGTGSYRQERSGDIQKLQVRWQDEEGVVIFGMPYNREKTGKILLLAEQYYKHASDLKRIGPASLDICRVASGRAKLYVELDLQIWDVAAGVLILNEAGGYCEKRGDVWLFWGRSRKDER